MWPIRVPIFEDELISSWICRISEMYGMPIQRIFKSRPFEPDYSRYLRHIDYVIPPVLAEYIERQAGSDIEVIGNHSCQRFLGRTIRNMGSVNYCRWIVPSRLTESSNGRGYAICPMCLAQGVESHYRVEWLFSLVTFCPEHRCILLNECPFCGARIYPWGLSYSTTTPGNLRICYRCGTQYGNGKVNSVDDVDTLVYRHLLMLVSTGSKISLPVSELVPGQNVLEFFEILYDLIWLFFLQPQGSRLVRAAVLEFGVKVAKLNSCGTLFEYLSPEHRYRIVCLVIALLESWPDKFLSIIRSAEKSGPRYKVDFLRLPIWVEKLR